MTTLPQSSLWTALLAAWLAGLAAFAGGLAARWEGSAETEGKREFVHGVVAFGGGILVAAVAFALTPLGMEHLHPATLGLVFVGYAPGAMAFAGGTFVPFPYAAFTPFVTNGAGTASVGYHWPAGVPSDLTLYVQSWLVDADAPAGFSATEAWQLVTP